MFAEKGFSEDLFNNLKFETRDVFPKHPKLVQTFIGKEIYLSKDDIEYTILESGLEEQGIDETVDILLWFSFFGVIFSDETKYTHQFSYDLEKVRAYIPDCSSATKIFYIHPTFYDALDAKK